MLITLPEFSVQIPEKVWMKDVYELIQLILRLSKELSHAGNVVVLEHLPDVDFFERMRKLVLNKVHGHLVVFDIDKAWFRSRKV